MSLFGMSLLYISSACLFCMFRLYVNFVFSRGLGRGVRALYVSCLALGRGFSASGGNRSSVYISYVGNARVQFEVPRDCVKCAKETCKRDM